LFDEQKPGESLTLCGRVQCGALNSRIRNGAVKVLMKGASYTVMANPDNAQQFLLVPDASFSRGGLAWGYMAFSSAIESGDIQYL
jgi:hypothetical protein